MCRVILPSNIWVVQPATTTKPSENRLFSTFDCKKEFECFYHANVVVVSRNISYYLLMYTVEFAWGEREFLRSKAGTLGSPPPQQVV